MSMDLELRLVLKKEYGLDDNQISEIEKSDNPLNAAMKLGYLTAEEALRIEEQGSEFDGEDTQIGKLDNLIEEEPELLIEGEAKETLLNLQGEKKDETLMSHSGESADDVPTQVSAGEKPGFDAEATKTIDVQANSEKLLEKEKQKDQDELLKTIGSIFYEKYELGKEIARGGMGAVVALKEKVFGKDLVLKVTLPGSDEERFKNEGKFTALLDHPGIANATEMGEIEFEGKRTPYFIQKRVRGHDLENILTGVGEGDSEFKGYWDVDRLLDVFLKVCDTVDYANSQGVIHRDLKPANIMVGQHAGEAYVMDWGLAKKIGNDVASGLTRLLKRQRAEKPSASGRLSRLASGVTRIFRKKEEKVEEIKPKKIQDLEIEVSKGYELTMDGDVAGTPGYMSPEQADGEVSKLDGRTDVFALGAILYKILTFEAPFKGEAIYNVIAATLSKDPEPASRHWAWEPKTYAKVLDSILKKALAKDAEDRYHTAGELADDVRRAMRHESVAVHQYGLRERYSAFNRRNHHIPNVAIGLLLAAGVLTGPIIGALGVQKSRAERQAREEAEGRAEAQEKAKDEALKRQREAEIIREVLEINTDAQEVGGYSKNYEAQIEMLTRAINLSRQIDTVRKSFALPYNNRGNAKLSLGDFDGALEDLAMARDIDPGFAMPVYNTGRVFVQKGELEKAVEWFGRAIEMEPGYGKFYFETLHTLKALGDWKKYVIVAKRCVGVVEGVDTFANLGFAYTKTEQPLLAEEAFEKAYQLSTDDNEKRNLANNLSPLYKQNNHYFGLGRLYSDFQMYDRAITALQTAIQNNDHVEEARALMQEIEQKKNSGK